MKKLKLKALEISAGGMLTREQLRNVMGKGSIGAVCGGGNGWVCGSDCCVNGYCAPCSGGSGGGPDCRQTGCPSGWRCGPFGGAYACYVGS